MIKIAKKSELKSDVFINLCYRNMQKEFCRNQGLCWQIPWNYYMADVQPEDRVLCVGAEQECIKKVIQNEMSGTRVIVLTKEEVGTSIDKFDLIVGCEGIDNFSAYQELLDEGGRFVFTDVFPYQEDGIDMGTISKIQKETNLIFYRKPNGLDVLNYQFKINELEDEVFVLQGKCFVGFVFYKNYSYPGIAEKKFSINKKRVCGEEANVILDYLEVDQDETFRKIKGNQYFRTFYLPSELSDKEYFTISDLRAVYQTDVRCALELMNELICGEYMVLYNEKNCDHKSTKASGNMSRTF